MTSPADWRLTPTAAIFFPWINTSPLAKLPTFGSMLRIVPPFSRIRRLGSGRETRSTISDSLPPRSDWLGTAATAARPALILKKSRRELRPSEVKGSFFMCALPIDFAGDYTSLFTRTGERLQDRRVSRVAPGPIRRKRMRRSTASRRWQIQLDREPERRKG